MVLLNMFCSDIVNHMDYWKVKCILATEQDMCEAFIRVPPHEVGAGLMLNCEAKASTSLVVELQLPQGGKRVVVSRDTGTRAIKQAAVSLQGGHTAPLPLLI